MKLTDATIRSLDPQLKQRVVADDSLAGFGLRISPQGTKAFVLTFGANRERVTIGRYPIISLQEARIEAKRILAERTLGKSRPVRTSLSGALETYYKTHVANLRPGSQKEIKRLFKRYFPSRGNLEEMTTPALTKILDRITSPSEAEHFHRSAKTFFKWCVERHLLPYSPIQHLRAPSKWKARERVLSDDELRAVWKAADSCGIFGEIVQLLIATGQRRSEIGSLQTSWISSSNSQSTSSPQYSSTGSGFEQEDGTNAKTNDVCTILNLPASITKNKRAHSVPVGELAEGILREAIALNPDGLLFPARGSTTKPFNGWSKAKAQLDKKIANHLQDGMEMVPWTLHDLRRTYATNLQRLGIKLEVIEALLNHISGTRAGIVGTYQRHRYEEEMRAAVNTFEAWFQKTILTHPDAA